MRDRRRIAPLIHALGVFWSAHPALSFGQLIVQLTGQDDPFYVEDDIVAETLSVPSGACALPAERQALLCAVQARWEANPDWRLGQLAVILASGQPPAAVDDNAFMQALSGC